MCTSAEQWISRLCTVRWWFLRYEGLRVFVKRVTAAVIAAILKEIA